MTTGRARNATPTASPAPPGAGHRLPEAAGDARSVEPRWRPQLGAGDIGRELGDRWAVAVDPADPERWYVSAASGPGAAHGGERARGRLYRWEGSWSALTLAPEAMPYALVAGDGELLAGMTDGQVLRSEDGGESWEELGVRVGSIVAMARSG